MARRMRNQGGAEVGGIWVDVESKVIPPPPDLLSTSTFCPRWLLRVPQRRF